MLDLDDKLWYTLFLLARKGAVKNPVEISSTRFCDELNVSQQTASRRLQELEKLGYITREIKRQGQLIKITEKGVNFLKELYYGLRAIFEEKPTIVKLEGEVFTGLGEGRFYLSLEKYRKQILEKLGFLPYPGTLNLKLKNKVDLETRKMLKSLSGIRIRGFRNDLRTYGDAICYPVLVNEKISGAIIFAQRTHYGDDVLEVIAPVCLRETLKLNDGDTVVLTVDLRQLY